MLGRDATLSTIFVCLATMILVVSCANQEKRLESLETHADGSFIGQYVDNGCSWVSTLEPSDYVIDTLDTAYEQADPAEKQEIRLFKERILAHDIGWLEHCRY